MFTEDAENEASCSSNFLDLTFTRNGDHLIFNSYRKPTLTNNLIPYSSKKLMGIKLNGYHAFIHRLLSLNLYKPPFDNGV